MPVLENVSRLEAWSFFEPPPAGGDPDYTLIGNRATIGARVDGRRFTVRGSFRYAQLLGLPDDAVGPGPLGAGAFYFAAASESSAYQLYFKSLSLQVKEIVPGLSVEAGRMSYESGQGTAFAALLMGEAEWTVFERAFDGLRVDYARSAWRAHASFVMPTQGAFEESAMPTMGKVQLASASWTAGSVQLFAHNYRDTRPVPARPDNTGRTAAAIDVNLQTIGASLTTPHLRLWAAGQRGRWYDDSHGAFSLVADAGHQWRGRWSPAIAAGLLYASGDRDTLDGEHATFFPMVPTTRPGALAGTFAQMNLRDIYAHATVHPRPSWTLRGELHHLSLATGRDRWYSGTGATAMRGQFFGFQTRASRLGSSLGNYLEAAAEAVINRHWTIKAAAGVLKGGEVIRRQFSGEWLRVVVVENRLAL